MGQVPDDEKADRQEGVRRSETDEQNHGIGPDGVQIHRQAPVEPTDQQRDGAEQNGAGDCRRRPGQGHEAELRDSAGQQQVDVLTRCQEESEGDTGEGSTQQRHCRGGAQVPA